MRLLAYAYDGDPEGEVGGQAATGLAALSYLLLLSSEEGGAELIEQTMVWCERSAGSDPDGYFSLYVLAMLRGMELARATAELDPPAFFAVLNEERVLLDETASALPFDALTHAIVYPPPRR